MTVYEQCVTDASGRCARWSHDHGIEAQSPAARLDLALAMHKVQFERANNATATVERVRALAFPDEDGYTHYAAALDDDVILAVGLDDLRAALNGGVA